MTLLEQLDRALPDWRLSYDNPMEAAVHLGLINPGELEEQDFVDIETSWQLVNQELDFTEDRVDEDPTYQ